MENIKSLKYKLGIYLNSREQYGKACIRLQQFEIDEIEMNIP